MEQPQETSKAAADLIAAATCKVIKYRWEQVDELGAKFVYFPEATRL